jgi:hypothetical protein
VYNECCRNTSDNHGQQLGTCRTFVNLFLTDTNIRAIRCVPLAGVRVSW